MTVRTPGTPASKIDRTPASTPGGPRSKEEKIVVTVRLRPLNKKEQLAKDQVAWECVDDRTIVFKPPTQERAAQQTPFTFGKLSENMAPFYLQCSCSIYSVFYLSFFCHMYEAVEVFLFFQIKFLVPLV